MNKHRKSFYYRERPVLYSKFEHTSPLFLPTHFSNAIIACPKGQFFLTPLPIPQFKKFVVTTHPHSLLDPL